MAIELQDPEYLGDGVYVGHDGYQLWLSLGSHEAEPLIALEQDVVVKLIHYGIRIGMLQPLPVEKPSA